jgi:myo-inositol 2-dehydrogenase/D-chiro-inositol 1-dehydrogenase
VLENTLSKSTKEGVVSAKPEFFFLERYMRAYSAEWAAFVDAVISGKALPVTLDDGVNALAVAEAATRSAKAGETVKLTDVI